MRYIGIKLDSTPIQMEPVTIRQYNNLVDTVVVKPSYQAGIDLAAVPADCRAGNKRRTDRTPS